MLITAVTAFLLLLYILNTFLFSHKGLKAVLISVKNFVIFVPLCEFSLRQPANGIFRPFRAVTVFICIEGLCPSLIYVALQLNA